MQDQKYKRSKWFIGIAALLAAYAMLLFITREGMTYAAISILFVVYGMLIVLGVWLADYLLFKKFAKYKSERPSTIDPKFKLKRNLILACAGLCGYLTWLSSL